MLVDAFYAAQILKERHPQMYRYALYIYVHSIEVGS
jgi:hypothetical protein